MIRRTAQAQAGVSADLTLRQRQCEWSTFAAALLIYAPSRRSHPPSALLRGCSIGTSASTCAGDGESRNTRSASPIASSILWVTSSVVTGRRETSSISSRAQSLGQRRVERDERLIEDQQIGFDREGSGQGDAARETERKFAGIVLTVLGKAERREQCVQCCRACLRRGERIFSSTRPPRKQTRFLKHHAEPAMRRAVTTLPSKSRSSPVMMRSNVVLPHPDGPTRAATSPLASAIESSPSTCSRPPVGCPVGFVLDVKFKPA